MDVNFSANINIASDKRDAAYFSLGTFMPFFYQDALRAVKKQVAHYYVAPEIRDNDEFELFYSDLEAWFLQLLDLLKAIIEGDTAAKMK